MCSTTSIRKIGCGEFGICLDLSLRPRWSLGWICLLRERQVREDYQSCSLRVDFRCHNQHYGTLLTNWKVYGIQQDTLSGQIFASEIFTEWSADCYPARRPNSRSNSPDSANNRIQYVPAGSPFVRCAGVPPNHTLRPFVSTTSTRYPEAGGRSFKSICEIERPSGRRLRHGGGAAGAVCLQRDRCRVGGRITPGQERCETHQKQDRSRSGITPQAFAVELRFVRRRSGMVCDVRGGSCLHHLDVLGGPREGVLTLLADEQVLFEDIDLVFRQPVKYVLLKLILSRMPAGGLPHSHSICPSRRHQPGAVPNWKLSPLVGQTCRSSHKNCVQSPMNQLFLA